MTNPSLLAPFLIHTLQENLNVMYAQVHQRGNLIEEYKRMPVKTRLNLWSVSKGTVSAATGIALDEGLITLDEKIVDIFPQYVPADPGENLPKVTLRHLLTMSSGLSNPLFFCDGPDRYTTPDWIEYFFTHGEFVHEPGSKFLYSNFNSYILSCVIESRAGMNLLEYLRDRYFEPMGMGNPDWTLCPKGHVHAANGLYFTIDEYSKYGEMLRNHGRVRDRQIVPEAFMREAMTPKMDLHGTGFGGNEQLNAWYGYQFVISETHRVILSNGNYGQYCLVIPEAEMTITVMSLEGNHPRIGVHLFNDVVKPVLGIE